MDEFLIQLQAKLDEAKSQENINNDISRLQEQLDKLKIQAILDPKTVQDLTAEIEKVINQKIVISNIGVDTSQANKAGQIVGQEFNDGVSQELNKSSNILNSFKKSLQDIGIGSEQIDAVADKINNLGVQIESLSQTRTKGKNDVLSVSISGIDQYGQIVKLTQQYNIATGELIKNIDSVSTAQQKVGTTSEKEQDAYELAYKELKKLYDLKIEYAKLGSNKDADFYYDRAITDQEKIWRKAWSKTSEPENWNVQKRLELEREELVMQDKLQKAYERTAISKKQIDEIQLSIGDKGNTTTQIKILSDSFTKLGLSTDEVKAKMSSVDTEFAVLQKLFNEGANDSTILSQFDKLKLALTETQNDLKTTRSEYSLLVSDQQRLSKANVIEAWNVKNTNASQEVLKANEAYIISLRDLNTQMTQMQFNSIVDGFSRTKNSMTALGKISTSLKNQLAQVAQNFTQWLSINSIIMALLYQLRKMPQAVNEIDTAMTNLYKVTDETESKYVRFLDSASNSANKLGRSISSLVDQTANWAKLGFDIDTASKLAEISSIYANVGEVDDETAVSDIVTAMKAFNIESAKAITIVDSLNKLGNEFATDAKSLGEGLRNSASSMAVAGNDLNQTLAILTGGGEITQNVAELSNGLRVVSMRLRGMKGALQEIGEEYENIESISKIQTQIYDLTKGSVNIFKDDGSFKSTYEQLKEISEIYFDLSDADRADLTEIIFGKNRANQGVAILQAFKSGQIEKAYEASINSAGSAYEEQSRWLESLEAKTKQFEAAFQSLSNTVVDSDILKGIVDLGTKGVSSLEGIVKVLNTINSLGGKTSGIMGTIGAVSGFLMNKNGIGERIMFQW